MALAKYIYKIGRRKTAIATLRLFEGKGISMVNGKPLTEVYIHALEQRDLAKPFTTLDIAADKFYYTAQVKGGGVTGQIGAIKLALSRALSELSPESHTALKRVGLLTRDPRMVERKKTGLRKARKREQYSKR